MADGREARGMHRQLGFARLEEYMERVLGYGPHAAPVSPDAVRPVVRFEVSGETLALLRDARIAVADATGEQLDHDALLATLCRSVLDAGGAAESTRARNQIALTI